MSDIIRLLPDSVANQIAAGEVIQRPASVIKELVENSIDAGATSVTIVLRDAGRTLIQVIDNGRGMSDTDARLAFERHATSKIAKAEDLFSLHTMGFRGEALASIAAIAQVDLRTQQHGEPIGTRLIINGSKVESQEPEVCAPGSNMMVKNLFFNVPVRRKFLKKDTVELAAIMREFERLALVNTGVDFTLISNDVTVHSLMHGPLKKRVCDLFGKNMDKQLIPIETDTSIVSITGFVGLPENARRRNPLQYFMVNGRNMRHPYFHKTVMQCYEKLISPDCQPNYFINLRVDPESIDVNIHPTKNEIKFENEAGVAQILTAAIRDSLGRYNVGPAIDFDTEGAPDIPAFAPEAGSAPQIDLDPGYNPFGTERTPTPWDILGPEFAPKGSERPAASSRPERTSRVSAVNTDWAKLYDDFMRKRDEGMISAAGDEPVMAGVTEDDPDAGLPIAGEHHADGAGLAYQYRDTYILTPTRDGLMVIDQHRAHLRVLYDMYLERARTHQFVAQATMFPDHLELSSAQSAILENMLDRMSLLGFVITRRGDNRWSIDGIPSQITGTPAAEMVISIIDTIESTGLDPAAAMHEQIALAMARGGAIRRGQQLSGDEMDRLISDLLRSPSPTLTPTGKRIFTIIPADYFSQLLG